MIASKLQVHKNTPYILTYKKAKTKEGTKKLKQLQV